MDTLFYDGQCPLCAKEIATLRKLETGNLVFADVHLQGNRKGLLPEREALLRRLHLLTSDGQWVVGLHATVRAWSHTRLGFLFKPLLWPVIYPLVSRFYSNWADRRYQRKYECDACSIKP
ncbi:thiol-disulfide oxidoreductase DCC family protein [Marinobacter halotolerans]|uniref:thiol-disulfide oxidoreductase DCC family protein n=1 Tax=Marinobacter halotolerans TaxID=1569211 RepID=UPI00124435CA|nr:DCC1-like thiol-disulfide oxidoreductase family protein [Marinobacter halotolerans]